MPCGQTLSDLSLEKTARTFTWRTLSALCFYALASSEAHIEHFSSNYQHPINQTQLQLDQIIFGHELWQDSRPNTNDTNILYQLSKYLTERIDGMRQKLQIPQKKKNIKMVVQMPNLKW